MDLLTYIARPFVTGHAFVIWEVHLPTSKAFACIFSFARSRFRPIAPLRMQRLLAAATGVRAEQRADVQGRDADALTSGGKRPRSSMSPTLVLDQSSKPFLAIGSPGGGRITFTVLGALIAVAQTGAEGPVGDAMWMGQCIGAGATLGFVGILLLTTDRARTVVESWTAPIPSQAVRTCVRTTFAHLL